MPEVTKGAALLLLLDALVGVPLRQRLFAVFMLLDRLTPEDAELETEVAAVEKLAEDWREEAFSTLACVCDVLEERAACAEERLLWWLESELLS